MSRKFIFLEDYPETGPLWEKAMLCNADLEWYFQGLPLVCVHNMVLDYILTLLKNAPPEARHEFLRRVTLIVDFLGKERFEDEEDFTDFVEMRMREITGPKGE